MRNKHTTALIGQDIGKLVSAELSRAPALRSSFTARERTGLRGLQSTMRVASPRGFSEMTIQPARHECHACCPLQAEKHNIVLVVGNTHGTHVVQVLSSFQKILRGSQLTWYTKWWRPGISVALLYP